MSTNNSRYNVLLDPSYVDGLQFFEPDLTVSQIARKAMRLLFIERKREWQRERRRQWEESGHPYPEYPVPKTPEQRAEQDAWLKAFNTMLKEAMPAFVQDMGGLDYC